MLDLSTAERLFHKQGKFDLIRVGADDGLTEVTLVERLKPHVASTLVINTAEAQATSDSKQTQDGLSLFKFILLGFGGIALFVGSFVIANTLAITVAQRMRELATLRTLGASRRQVLGSVVLESIAIGLVGSLVGLFLGLAIALGLMSLLGAIGVQLPDASLVFSIRTVVVSIGVGTLIALLASLRPAVRATRIEPIAAVREGAMLPQVALRALCRTGIGADPRSSPWGCSRTGCSRTISTSRCGWSPSSPACCSCSSVSQWWLPASFAPWRTWSAPPVRASAAWQAGSHARTQFATRPAPPQPPPP